MMRKILSALCIVLFAMISVPVAVQASTQPTAQEVLLIKKKKLAAQKLAEQKKKQALARQIAAKKQVLAFSEKRAKAKRRDCGSFLQCLFGKSTSRRNSNTANASFGSFSQSGLSGRTTNSVVDWNETKYPAGSLIVKTPERALYFVKGNGEAIRYSIGVGREGFQWSGNSRIVSKQEWPSWTPPAEMIKREAEKGHILPDFMEGGPGNPLGARALYIGGKIYRVHGTNNEASIGGAVSSGCIRMMNADVIDLYDRVKIGAKIFVYQ
jgi:lipoprotein-anchoring transpeptidase ErfK/SrfK